MTVHTIEAPVLIAGGGPVGLTLAMDLAWRGVESIVLEKRREVPPNPRCNTTNARSMEIFRRLGCADALRAAGLPADHNTDVVYMTHFNGDELTRYVRPTTQDWLEGNAQGKGIGWDWPTPEAQHFVSQIYMEPVLRQHAVSHFGVDLRTGWELLSFTQDDDGVTALARDIDTGEEVRFHALYLIGADGGPSKVRAAIGARLQGIPEVGKRISTFMRAPHLKTLYAEHPGWMYRFVGGANLVAIDGHDLWLTHVRVPPDEDIQRFDAQKEIFDAIGESFDYEIIQEVRWTPRAMVANKFRDRRIFLTGDAAHIWVPMGGFGMNSGVGDAISLGWMLAGVLQNWLSPKIFDAFEAERAPLGARVAKQAARWISDLRPLTDKGPNHPPFETEEQRGDLGRRISDVNLVEFDCPGMQLGYYYENSPIIAHDGTAPPPFSLGTYSETSWPGVRAPHIWRDSGASLYDELGSGFTLLRIGANPPTGATLAEAALMRGIPFKILDVTETEAVVKYQDYGLVLVRPDQHIVWRSKSEPADAGAIFDRVTGVLMPEHAIAEYSAKRIGGDFMFGEGLRWKDGRLVFSDMLDKKVLSFDPITGLTETLFYIEHQPNGLGVLPDGRLIISSMFDGKLYAGNDGHLEEFADLSHLVTGYLGDMVIDKVGRIYVGDIGGRILHGEKLQPGRIILVDTDRHARIALDNLQFPNGLVITPDGNTLIVSESQGGRLVQSRIGPDGSLLAAKPFVTFTGKGADGLAIDKSGGIWSCMLSGGVTYYDGPGRLTAHVDTPDGTPIACAVGGKDGETLYIVGVEHLPEETRMFDAMAAKQTRGWIAEVAIPN